MAMTGGGSWIAVSLLVAAMAPAQGAVVAGAGRACPIDLAVATPADEAIGFGLTRSTIEAAFVDAGFRLVGEDQVAPLRLYLTVSQSKARTGSSVRREQRREWIEPPRRDLRSRLFGGRALRLTVLVVETASGKEILRTVGVRHAGTRDDAAAPALLAKLLKRRPRPAVLECQR
ncbi:MAG: hypothetical protein ABW203_08460 [Novosphingobium sp.]